MIDFTVDLNNRCILILDNYNKIIKSDLHGNLIAEKSLPKENRHFLNSIHVFNGTLFAYTGQESANEKKYQVIRFDEDLDPVDYLFPYTFSFPAVRSFGNALYTFDNNLNFVSEWGFSIYQLRGGKFEERYSLDFSGKELSLEGITLEEFAKNKTHSYLFSTCVEGDDAIFLPIFAEERPMYGFLLKKSSKFLLIRNMNEDSLAFIPPGSYANNRYISLISSHIFNKRFPNNNIKPDISDNPIILEYKLNFKDEK
jgi:hypothetical protein